MLVSKEKEILEKDYEELKHVILTFHSFMCKAFWQKEEGGCGA
jgi:hypothetical protein